MRNEEGRDAGVTGREPDVVPGAIDLVDRLKVIEAQPLGVRADAYSALHEELAARLEGAPGAR